MADVYKTTDEIAADLGLTRQGVWFRIRRLDMKPAKMVGGAAMFSRDQIKKIAAASAKKTPASAGG